MGVDGLDLTVRPGGHIKPAEVKAQLPLAARAARDHGLRIMMLTTGITGPGRVAEETLAACQREGIDRIKLGYYRVGEFGSLARRLDEVRRQLESVVELSAKYKVRPCVHVHSGPTIPSSGWMLLDLVRKMPPERVGAYLDSYHMTITGGAGGWRQAIDLLRPWSRAALAASGSSVLTSAGLMWPPGRTVKSSPSTPISAKRRQTSGIGSDWKCSV